MAVRSIKFTYNSIHFVGDLVLTTIKRFGAFGIFLRHIFQLSYRRPYRIGLTIKSLEFIGNQSLGIIMMTGFFTGAVFGLQIGGIFEIFRAEGLMGGATGKALARELAPLMTGFLISGRVGSAMTAEIATMKVNEQVDAMEAMAVDPVDYLVVPRVIASLLAIPLLCGVFMFLGVVGAYVTGIGFYDIDQGVFMEKLVWLVDPKDIWAGIEKMFVFALIIPTIACRFGLTAGGGAKGVGIATTNSVVTMLLTILAMDFIITYIQIALSL